MWVHKNFQKNKEIHPSFTIAFYIYNTEEIVDLEENKWTYTRNKSQEGIWSGEASNIINTNKIWIDSKYQLYLIFVNKWSWDVAGVVYENVPC